MSIKSTIAAIAASPFLFAGAAFAGPYVNVESNISYPDGDYSGASTDLHIGYEGDVGSLGYYVQGGPQFGAADGADGETDFSGKGGLNIAASEKLDIYGEISFVTDEVNDTAYGTKIGAKYKF